MTFQKGKKYAITGESGSGKSTLLNILTGRYQDYSGQIRIDGHDFTKISPSSWHNNVAYVAQSPYLFQKSILYNITLERNYSEPDLVQALENSSSKPFIDSLPQGLETSIAANQTNLSGGQLQRLTIARQLLDKKPLLILDEATSSLDHQNAIAVEKNLLSDPELTVICVTHALHKETQNYFDVIYSLDS
ncbi:MAG TPA: ATP-binding cassette domain-containing protein [Candidatus Tetragenococcus pullicola]|nr:ATP-binding cassette domain-containing protein [Candidatus Tetragenococcus pullicola]